MEQWNEWLWLWGFLPLFVLCALRWGRRTRLRPLRELPRALTLPFRREEARGTMSPLQAACTALSASIGTGNIVGTAQALLMGGPGALLWLWIGAGLGMLVKYGEIVLCQRLGGPMAYIRRALGKGSARAYGLLALFSAFCMGDLAQANGLASALTEALGQFIPMSANLGLWLRIGLGLSLGALIWYLLRGGAGAVGRTAEQLVPVMGLAYLGMGAWVLIRCGRRLPGVLRTILELGLEPRAMAGAMLWGLRRGVFSNEAGLGSAALAHGCLQARDPETHGLWGVFEVTADTLICTVTGLVILCSPVVQPYGSLPGAEALARALSCFFDPALAGLLVALSLLLFGFSTILGASVFAASCLGSLCGRVPALFVPVWSICVLLGAVLPTGAVFSAADTVNVLMALPNLTALFLLAPDGLGAKKGAPGRAPVNGSAWDQNLRA